MNKLIPNKNRKPLIRLLSNLKSQNRLIYSAISCSVLNPIEPSHELSFLTTTSTDIPIKTGGARSKNLFNIEQIIAE